jgi:hypothetical protein
VTTVVNPSLAARGIGWWKNAAYRWLPLNFVTVITDRSGFIKVLKIPIKL